MREDTLARILVIMEGMPGITTAVRNRGLRENEDRPAMVLLDGDESPRVSFGSRLKGMASLMAPQIVEIRPEVYILLKEKRPKNEAVGEDLNAFRIEFMRRLWTDTELATILGANGSIVYNGLQTDLKSGSAMSGEMRLDFVATYVLKPTAA
jgi:hypothetical protein